MKPGEMEDRRAFLFSSKSLLKIKKMRSAISLDISICICLPQNEKTVSMPAIQTSGDAKAKRIIRHSFLNEGS